MKTFFYNLGLALLLAILLSSCSQFKKTINKTEISSYKTPSPTTLKTITPSITATSTVTPSPTSTQTATFMPVTPVAIGTVFLKPTVTILINNIDRVSLFARWGNGNVGQALFTPDGNYLLTAASTGIYFYDTDDYSIAKIIKTTDAVFRIAISPDGKMIAATTFNEILLFRTDDQQLLSTFEVSAGSLAFSPDGKNLAASTNKRAYNSVIIWDVNSGNQLQNLPSDDYPAEVKFSPNGNIIAAAGVTTKIWLMDGTLADQQGPYVSGGFTFCVSFSPDGKILAEGSDANVIHLWRVSETGKLTIHKNIYLKDYPMVNAIAISPDGKLLASGATKSLTVYEISTGNKYRKCFISTKYRLYKLQWCFLGA